jgi:hypothetical protein
MQRFTISVCAAAATLILAAISWAPWSVSAAPKSIVGTWELVSGEINGEPITGKHIKMISAHHFMWVIYDSKTQKTQGAGSGTYTLNGDSYIEHIEFFDVAGVEGMVGTDAKFTVKVDDDTLMQEGMAGKTTIKEKYKRLD